MKLSDKIRFVRQNMAKNKSRVFMTILATAMGCSFLMMIASVAFGLQRSMVDNLLQGQTVTQIQVHGKKEADNNYVPATLTDAESFKAMEHVKAVTAQLNLQGNVALQDYKNTVHTIVTNIEQEVKAGLKLSEGQLPAKNTETVVGYHFAEQLRKEGATNGYDQPLLGQTITFQAKGFNHETKKKEMLAPIKLTIVGILDKPAREWVEDSTLYLDDSWEKAVFFNGSDLVPNIKVYADKASNVTMISKALRSSNFSIYSVADSVKEMDLVFLVMKIGLIFVGTIAVLIASIGIYNTMTMAVTERAQDIGIMKAIGATPKTIRSVFMMESFGIGLCGAIIGIAVSYGLSIVINAAVPPIISSVLEGRTPKGFTFTYIPLSLTLVSVAISLGVAVLSGMRPARRATRIDVLSALRRDI
ncbi:ABC transporter permease [Paenibacillus sp. GCM10027626]|uniref:ABC transporter permease n=1 Tax=Paenibacillus sp. GCM10027626 TaxID=3273411 RepID=UPI00363C55B5